MCYYPECVWAGLCKNVAAATLVGGRLLWSPEGCGNPFVFLGSLESPPREDEFDKKIDEYCLQNKIQRRRIKGVAIWLKEDKWHLTDDELCCALGDGSIRKLLGLPEYKESDMDIKVLTFFDKVRQFLNKIFSV